MTYAISQYLFNEKGKCDEVVVETQVLGVKPPQICKKNNTQKFGDTKKEKGPKVWWCKIGKNKE